MMSGPLFAMVTQRASFIGLPKIIKRIGRLTWWKCGDFVLHLNWSSHCIVWTDEIHLVGTNFWGCGSGFGCGGASELCQFLRWQATKTKKIEKTSTMTRIFSAWSFARTRQNPRFESASFHLVATQSSRCKKKKTWWKGGHGKKYNWNYPRTTSILTPPSAVWETEITVVVHVKDNSLSAAISLRLRNAFLHNHMIESESQYGPNNYLGVTKIKMRSQMCRHYVMPTLWSSMRNCSYRVLQTINSHKWAYL